MSAPVITCTPEASIAYDDAEPAASDTKARPRLSKENPNGVPPAEGLEIPASARPSRPTANVSIELEVFSVTTSVVPSLENATCAGPEPRSGCVDPESGATRPVPSSLKPVMLDEPAFST